MCVCDRYSDTACVLHVLPVYYMYWCVCSPPPTEAVVLFDYEKMQDDEIDLKLGDIIQDVKQVSG